MYKRHHWSLPERALVYCSTHYLRAMLLLWTAAAGAVIAAEYFRPVFHSFTVNYLKGVTTLPAWMSNLLGAQLFLVPQITTVSLSARAYNLHGKWDRLHFIDIYVYCYNYWCWLWNNAIMFKINNYYCIISINPSYPLMRSEKYHNRKCYEGCVNWWIRRSYRWQEDVCFQPSSLYN